MILSVSTIYFYQNDFMILSKMITLSHFNTSYSMRLNDINNDADTTITIYF